MRKVKLPVVGSVDADWENFQNLFKNSYVTLDPKLLPRLQEIVAIPYDPLPKILDSLVIDEMKPKPHRFRRGRL